MEFMLFLITDAVKFYYVNRPLSILKSSYACQLPYSHCDSAPSGIWDTDQIEQERKNIESVSYVFTVLWKGSISVRLICKLFMLSSLPRNYENFDSLSQKQITYQVNT